jgi:hypothetical protein
LLLYRSKSGGGEKRAHVLLGKIYIIKSLLQSIFYFLKEKQNESFNRFLFKK